MMVTKLVTLPFKKKNSNNAVTRMLVIRSNSTIFNVRHDLLVSISNFRRRSLKSLQLSMHDGCPWIDC